MLKKALREGEGGLKGIYSVFFLFFGVLCRYLCME